MEERYYVDLCGEDRFGVASAFGVIDNATGECRVKLAFNLYKEGDYERCRKAANDEASFMNRQLAAMYREWGG